MTTRFYTTIKRPSGSDPGRIEIGHYVLDGDRLILTNERGFPVRGKEWTIQLNGADPLATARRLLRRYHLRDGDFNRPLPRCGPLV